MKNNSTIQDSRRKAAVLAAALKATDKDDFDTCVQDMQKLAELDPNAAKIVAAAIRAKQVPAIIKEAGLENEDALESLMSPLKQTEKTMGFADEKEPSEEEEEHEEMESPEEEEEEHESAGFPFDTESDEEENDNTEFTSDTDEGIDIPEEMGEADEEGNGSTATINIEVPAEMLNDVKAAIEKALFNEFGDKPETEGISAVETSATPELDAPEASESEEAEPTFESEPQESEEPRSVEMEKKEAFVPKEDMSDDVSTAIAARKAYRQNLLTRVAADPNSRSEDTDPKDIGLGKDTSYNGKAFQYAEEAQYEGEREYPAMTMENSAGNSLYDNPGYAKIPVPTQNPENLMLKDSYEKFNFTNGSAGDLEYSVDFNAMEKIPSEGELDTEKKFEVPTQLQSELPKHKTTVAAREITCQGCNNPRHAAVDVVDCEDCKTRISLCSECQDDLYCPSCATQVKTASECGENCGCGEAKITTKNQNGETVSQNKTTINIPKGTPVNDLETDIEQKKVEIAQGDTKEAAIYKARIKTAYDWANRLCRAGVIEDSEVNDQVDLWMNGNLDSQTMKVTGKLMLRSVQSSAERIANKQIDNVRTASVRTSVNPSFIPSSDTQSVGDMQTVLNSYFMERFAEK